jgi:hypothetical protein
MDKNKSVSQIEGGYTLYTTRKNEKRWELTPINKFSDFRVLNFKGLELLVGSYAVPGEYAVRKLVNTIREADFVGDGVQPSIVENLRLWALHGYDFYEVEDQQYNN